VSLSPSGNSLADLVLPVSEASQVGEARRQATQLAERIGFDDAGSARVALIVAELATNLAKHARDGELLVHPLERLGNPGLEILSVDRGPGMLNTGACLRDGYSTTGSPGTGLGAVARQSESLDVFSPSPAGTALLVRLWSGGLQPKETVENVSIGAACVPKPGEVDCGDAWAAEAGEGRRLFLMVADGLGHGLGAADAARQAVKSFRANARSGPVAILRAMNQALRATRGAAVAVADLDLDERTVRYAGVGNISGSVLSAGEPRSLVSHNGTVGHAFSRVQEFAYPFPRGALLVLHSDGLGTRWDLSAYPGLAGRAPGLVAGVLYRDFQRGRDDVTVLVAREADA
jgi:anti-sigma regulatory factor (Ser/Thr protein kinase)